MINVTPAPTAGIPGEIPWVPIVFGVATGLVIGYMISESIHRSTIKILKQRLNESNE